MKPAVVNYDHEVIVLYYFMILNNLIFIFSNKSIDGNLIDLPKYAFSINLPNKFTINLPNKFTINCHLNYVSIIVSNEI